jgi:DNA-binding transcriptional LysR family regulator
MDTRSWKIIAELHRTANITKAADRLSMTQPALSKRLQLIEQELAVKLVVRTPKGVTFTPEGEYVAQEAVKILEHILQVRTHLLTFGDRQSGTIKLGMTNSFVRYTLPPYLKGYKADHAGVEFGITTDVSSQIVDRLERGDIHVGFIYGDIEGQFQKLQIGTDHACLVNSEIIGLEKLPETSQISYLSDPFAMKMMDGWWNSHFSKPPLIGMRANHGDTCLEMIANGLGYGIFLSPKFVGDTRPLFRMPLYYADGRPFARNSWMIWKDEFSATPLVKNFLKYMDEQMNTPGKES